MGVFSESNVKWLSRNTQIFNRKGPAASTETGPGHWLCVHQDSVQIEQTNGHAPVEPKKAHDRSRRMTARGVDFLELWVERNVLPRVAEPDQATRLAEKLAVDAVSEGVSVATLRSRVILKPTFVTSSCTWASRECRETRISALETPESSRQRAWRPALLSRDCSTQSYCS